MNKAFYPGAGTDIIPPILFRNIKNWIYMDSQPKSEFGNKINSGYRQKFFPNLLTIMLQNEFDLKGIEGDTLTFYNSLHEQTIKYETNSVFPEDLRQRHRDCDTLVLVGYSLTNPPPNFISSYKNIIIDSINRPDPDEQSILLFKNVFLLIVDKNFIYGDLTEYTTKNIIKYVVPINTRYNPIAK